MINYTEEEKNELIKLYKEGVSIEELMEKFNKPKKSIIGKLSKEKVYVKQVYRSKTGELPITKKELIANLAQLIDADPEKLQGLEKAPKIELQYLISKIS